MLGYSPYYHGILKKVVVAFGRIFTGLKIVREDKQGNPVQIIDVPVSYGPKDKWLARLQEQADLTNKTAITLPRIGFEMVAMSYDPSRKIQTMNLIKADNSTTNENVDATFSPVPYNVTFNLYIVAKTNSDALQIVEQILPFFTPQYTITMDVVPEVLINQDIPVTLVNSSFTDSYEGAFSDKREIIYTLTFDIKCYLFGPATKYNTILQTIMNIDPMYGTITRRATSTATQNIDGEWTITDAIVDINRDPTIY